MPSTFSSIKQSALALSPEERERLANELFESLTPESQKEIELSWVKEAEQRYNDVVSGKTKTISGETVTREIRELLR